MNGISGLARLLRGGLAAFLLLSALGGGDARAAPPAVAPVSGEQDDASPKRGLLYEVSDGTATLYLFGTIHVGKPEFYPLNRTVIEAFRRSNVLAVEADITDKTTIAREIAALAMYPAADSLDRHISPELMQKVEQVLRKYDFPLDKARRLKPWMLALTLDYIGGDDAGYGGEYGADVFLLGLAKAMNKPVAEVESMRFQIRLFDSLTPAEQEDYLASAVDELASGEFVAEMNELVEAWARADAAAIARAVEEGEAALPAAAKRINEKLITDRNTSMTHSIEDYLRSGSLYFVAVGAGHLVGGDGIVARLKAKGYRVRNMQ